jgi:hypothetical protein
MTCAETLPFPHPTPEQRERVGEAARRLVELRDGWLNPPGPDPVDLAKREEPCRQLGAVLSDQSTTESG